MRQFREFFGFELKLRFKSFSTYAYFLLWFLFSFFCVASENFGPIGASSGKVLLNGPYALWVLDSGVCLFGIIVLAAIFGTSILRDFQRDTYQILFTKPLTKFAYLGGRWAGSWVTALFVFSAVIPGAWLGTYAPWADQARIGPNHLWWYVQPFLSIICVQTFFIGALFFAVAALTRNLLIVYLQGVALFILYLIGLTVFSATRSLEHFWSGIFDPIGWILRDDITRYWTVAERNTLLAPWDFSGNAPGVFLYNRLLWLAVGVLALAATAWRFPFSVESLTTRAQGKRAAKAREQDAHEVRATRSFVTQHLPKVTQRFGASTTFAQFLSLSRLRARAIFKEIPYWAMAALLVVFGINNGYFAGHTGEQNVWPVTYLMLNAVEGNAALFFYIVATLYAAEMLWRERDSRFDGIHDALPLSTTVDWLARFVAIAAAEIVLLVLTMLCGIFMQTVLGYHHYELPHYLRELFVLMLPQVLGFTLLAMFVQTLVSNKFVGHAIVLGIFIIVPVLYNFGLENTLLLPGQTPNFVYSDMNGYGFYVPMLFWAVTYWCAIFAVLGVVSMLYARRGAEVSLRVRTRLALAQTPRLAPLALLFLVVAVGSGGWYYYNTHVLNDYSTADSRRAGQADYERDFKQYEHLPQPKITAVDTQVEIDPAKRSFSATGTYTLQNKSGAPIGQLHFTDVEEAVRELSFDRPTHLVSSAPHDLYSIYKLDTPLAPGETMTVKFKVGHDSNGFRDGPESTGGSAFGGDKSGRFVDNGTFFDASYFPILGYIQDYELDDPRRRRENHLGDLEDMAPRGDETASRTNLFTPNSDWITFHAVVGTAGDQTAMAPGYLQKTWQANGRNYYEYSMGDTHTLDFFAFISGRYSVKKEVYQGVNGPISVEVYYDPIHPYDIDDMLDASRTGLAYYEKNFSPFQFSQYRILEYPRYRTFAQSFPNTVPFSEGIGFIGRVVHDTDVDITYFVTAHELGHQWWGHQLIGGRVQGSNMMSETLAQYSAYMVMRQHYGPDYMHRVMRHFLDRYLRGRAGETRHEPPLALVQRESYVWYEKGGQIMYTLADYVGEDKINLALHNFLMRWRYANATNQVDATDQSHGTVDQPYPDTRMLIDALREQTPPELQYLIDDGFNRIVLYDNRALSAKSRKLPDGRYEVTLDVQARKVQADGNGVESPMALADYIDIGVFEGEKDKEKPLYMKREKISDEHKTFTIIVDREPTRAGIDPYNKLIDRISDDNMIDVEKG